MSKSGSKFLFFSCFSWLIVSIFIVVDKGENYVTASFCTLGMSWISFVGGVILDKLKL